MKPPVRPTRSEMMLRKNSITTVATTRGVTSFFNGSTPMARMASICSVTFMEPSSLAMPLELRPATIKPVSTGPSSRTIDTDSNQIALQQGVGKISRPPEDVSDRACGEQGVILHCLDLFFDKLREREIG